MNATGQDVLDAIDGTKTIRWLFSREQRAFHEALLPQHGSCVVE